MRFNTTTCAALAAAAACFLSSAPAQAQAVFNPVPINGLTIDVFAESLPSNLSTDASLDASYSDFAFLANGVPSAIPASGTITEPNRTYQLAGFSGPNAAPIPVGQTISLNLATPARFETLSLLGLATDGDHNLSVVVTFVGGATQPAVVGLLRDWSDATNAIGGDFARVRRPDDQIQTPYRMFAVDVPIRPQDQGKLVSSITITNAAPFGSPKSNIFAVSGVASSGPAPVPTMSEWAMILLTGLLLAVGAGQVMRTRRA